MILSNIGVIADILWHEIKNHTNNIKLDEFVVMPNHIHGILIIDSDSVTPLQFDSVAPLHARGLQNQKNQYFSDISPKAGSISTIIRSYKSAVTKHSRRLAYEFGWQAKFHDHIIRNEEEYFKIRNNPQKWDEDKFY
jgi:REP element-mobilizing transposase RayT